MKKYKYEFEYDNEDFKFLTKVMADRIADKNQKYKCFKKCNSEIDYMCAIKGNNVDGFVSLIMQDELYYSELIKIIITNLKVIQVLYENNKSEFTPKNINFKINNENKQIIAYFGDLVNKKNEIVIEFTDIVWCSLLYQEKQLYQIIHELILTSPIKSL